MGATDESDDPDRGDGIDKAIQRLRTAFDDAVDDAEKLGDEATDDVRNAIDDLEERIRGLRGKKEQPSESESE